MISNSFLNGNLWWLWINIIVKGWGLQACSYICDKQCRSQGQNPKDDAKARTLKAKAKAWTLEVKAKALNPQDQGHKFVSSRPRPVLEDYIMVSIVTSLCCCRNAKTKQEYCTSLNYNINLIIIELLIILIIIIIIIPYIRFIHDVLHVNIYLHLI